MADTLIEVFSKNLRRWLSMEGRTQAELARYMKVSTATASDWCNGRKMPRSDKLQSICNWFGISLGDLLEEYSIGAPSPGISKEELSLLDGYRALSHEGRAAVRAFVAFTAAGERERESRNSTG